LRAKFSAVTKVDIDRAMDSLQEPNKLLADAVEIRQKIDLYIGASFTQFQTLSFKELYYPGYQVNDGVKRVIR